MAKSNLTVRFSIVGDDMTTMIQGVGRKKLQKALDKMQDGLSWTLVIQSKASLRHTTNNPGTNANPDGGKEITIGWGKL